MKMLKEKIVIIGPKECGKTIIANILSDSTETAGNQYNPTQGVRILEFELAVKKSSGRNEPFEIELWDCSGDSRFQSCWPAMGKDAVGAVFVYNPDKESHSEELETLYNHFVKQNRLKESQCLLLAHHKPNTPNIERCVLSEQFRNINQISTNASDSDESGLTGSSAEAQKLRDSFTKFAKKICEALSERRDAEEQSIMGLS